MKKQMKKPTSKLELAGVFARRTLVLPLGVVVLITAISTIVAMLWWELLGVFTKPMPQPVRNFVCRWLGALPFSWTLSATLWAAATLAWALRGKSIKARVSEMADACISKLETLTRFREMGGFW